ncbi:hypothetical protein HPB51_010742 [Rhipicephalus microplus]|uniref:Uncharacterized protein n=1 Tax=Rhipicephalus microplus TaxID=6941 RepID=A0A9J6DUY0_RHIMP|nr:hypothetical protein HPB51_010742 [Rhipicephalus microplus]
MRADPRMLLEIGVDGIKAWRGAGRASGSAGSACGASAGARRADLAWSARPAKWDAGPRCTTAGYIAFLALVRRRVSQIEYAAHRNRIGAHETHDLGTGSVPWRPTPGPRSIAAANLSAGHDSPALRGDVVGEGEKRRRLLSETRKALIAARLRARARKCGSPQASARTKDDHDPCSAHPSRRRRWRFPSPAFFLLLLPMGARRNRASNSCAS